ncbi:MAG: hypothetical protein ACR2FI_10275 [Burkholderiales bacterium]|nr:hypothetical protein [Burkholderiales bacterium]MDQ3196611.1 hypothetical protein [Pseudomonadota bacterium]
MHRIWQTNQPEERGDDHVDLASGGVTLLVHRRDFTVALEPLEKNDFALLSLIAAGQRLVLACDHVLQSEPAFDAAVFLQRRVMDGTLVDFRVAGFR